MVVLVEWWGGDWLASREERAGKNVGSSARGGVHRTSSNNTPNPVSFIRSKASYVLSSTTSLTSRARCIFNSCTRQTLCTLPGHHASTVCLVSALPVADCPRCLPVCTHLRLPLTTCALDHPHSHQLASSETRWLLCEPGNTQPGRAPSNPISF